MVSEISNGVKWFVNGCCVFLPVITFYTQLKSPAPYGRHDPKDGGWGPAVNQKLAHVLNDGLWGVCFFIYALYTSGKGVHGIINHVLTFAWLVHFGYRGFIHPFYMRYSSKTIALGIPVTGLTLALYSYAHATQFSTTVYDDDYIYDVRFILGSIIFLIGFGTNKWADYTLRNLRLKSGETKYFVPKGGLFQLVSCPNYLGEMIEWLGWALASWSIPGFLYFCFASATVIPRSKHNHQWCCLNLKNYPRDRRALIPFVY